jgi:transposase-like protein
MEDMFNERPTAKLVINYIKNVADYYAETEDIHISRILNSPFVHVDETPVSIQGVQWYIWVFTDGQHVVLKLSETRDHNC